MIDENRLWKSVSDIKVSMSTNNQKLDEIFRWMKESDEDKKNVNSRLTRLEAFKMAIVWVALGAATAASAVTATITTWIKGN